MRPQQTLLTCLLTAAWFAALVAIATLRLNSGQLWSPWDRFFLFFDLAVLYTCSLAVYAGGLILLHLMLTRHLSPRLAKLSESAGLSRHLAPLDQGLHLGLSGAPWIPWTASLLLPEVGPLGQVMEMAIDNPLPWPLLGIAWFLALAIVGLGILVKRVMSEAALRRCVLASALLPLVPLGILFQIQGTVETRELLLSPLPDNSNDPSGNASEGPMPLILLVVDGADLDDMILPLIEAGDLPTFENLMKEGTWGHLKSRKPTLSPVLWTTLATGKPLEEHGIRDFVFYHLPGVRPPIHRFPAGCGIDHRIFPHLEKLSLGFERPPFSRLQRRARPLWDIIGERHQVGVYRWLVTWPAEQVSGFLVSGGVYAGPGDWNPKAKSWLQRMRRRRDNPLESLSLYPADAMDGLPPFILRPPAESELSLYAPDVPVARRHKHFRLVARSLAEPTGWELPRLIDKYAPRFVAASFYPVDAFQHRFGKAYRDDEPWAGAIAQRYRETDRQLGSFLSTLPEKHHLVVISDHGYDFSVDHHWEAPAGVFFARGPAFEAGRRFDGLGQLDIAPMILQLLDFPLPDDMPGSLTGRFRRALRADWPLTAGTLATYARPPSGSEESTLPATLSDEMKDELRSLGYIQ